MTVHDAVSKRPKVPPGPEGGFLVGNSLEYLRDPMGFVERAKRDYGDMVRLRHGLRMRVHKREAVPSCPAADAQANGAAELHRSGAAAQKT